jgi:hypothetical protein
MRRKTYRLLSVALLSCFAVLAIHEVLAQTPGIKKQQGTAAAKEAPGRANLPNDEKLVDLYIKFVKDAEKIAQDYERQGKPEKARGVYEEILKLVPEYKPARTKLDDLKKKEATAERKSIELSAKGGWQDTGVWALAGKPLSIVANGNWSAELRVKFQGNADGLELPEEFRNNPFGSLIGMIVPPPSKDKDNGKTKAAAKKQPNETFAVGQKREFTPTESGKLMLKMNAPDSADPQGRIRVEIMGTFERR